MKTMRQKFNVLMLMSFVGAMSAEATTYKRFWRGYSIPDLSSEQFDSEVNNKIIPATRNLFSKDSGLVSYLPVLTNKQSVSESNLVADEFALLDYESEDKYRKFRATPEGIAYGDLHWEMFDKNRSKSAVVENFTNKIGFEKAYNVFSNDTDLKKSKSYFSVRYKNPSVSEAVFLEAVYAYLLDTRAYADSYGMKSMIVLVMQDHVAVYEAWDSEASKLDYEEMASQDMPTGETTLDEISIKLMNISLSKSSAKIHKGEGLKLVRP